MIAVLIVAVVVLALALAGAGVRVEQMQREQHTECIDRIIGAISKSHDETLIRQLAERWDSVEEQVNLHMLAREKYSPGGPSMPAIWLYDVADQIKADQIKAETRSHA